MLPVKSFRQRRKRVRPLPSPASTFICITGLLLLILPKGRSFGLQSQIQIRNAPPFKANKWRQNYAKPPDLLEEQVTEKRPSFGEDNRPPDLAQEEDQAATTASTPREDMCHFDDGNIQEMQSHDDALTEKDSVLLSRRKWLEQCSILVGGVAVSGATLFSHEKAKQRQEEDRKAFIRLKRYPHRQKVTRSNTTITTSTSRSLANATSATASPTKNTTSIKNATSTTTSKNATTAAKNKNATTASNKQSTTTKPPRSNATTTSASKELQPVNFTKVASENTINITLKSCDGGCVRVNGTSLQKYEDRIYPWYWPKILRPAPKVLKDIPDKEVLLAATVAGSAIEMVRTTLLYPLSTVKTRIQTRQQEQLKQQRTRRIMAKFQSDSSFRVPSTADMGRDHNNTLVNETSSSSSSKLKTPKASQQLQLRRRLRVLGLNVRRHVEEGNLYAGLVPSLLVSVPATGVYYGVRDVTKRMLATAPGFYLNDALITLVGAFVADVVSLMARTPADALAARLQAVAASAPSSLETATKTKLEAIAASNATVLTDIARDSSPGMLNATDHDVAATTIKRTPEVEQRSLHSVVPTKMTVKPSTLAPSNDTSLSPIEREIEALLQEEYNARKETTLVVNDTHLDRLEEDDEHLLLQRLEQRREINLQDLYSGLGAEKDSLDKATMRSQQTPKRVQRTRPKKKGAISENPTTPPLHLYTLEFLEGIQPSENATVMFENMTFKTTITDWDPPFWDLVSVMRLRWQQLAESLELEKNETKRSGDVDNEMAADSMDNSTSILKKDDKAEVRMQEKEERELLQELQEETVYQEDWFRQSLQRLPAIIITDLPYLLSRIALNRIVIHGTVNIGQYEVATIGIAVVCSLLTTPFDVVRTRLLVENNDKEVALCDILPEGANATLANATMMIEEEPDYLNQGVLQTMICIAKEGDGGVRNLYAGWLERTLYFGIGRAWIDPINIITYIGIRDTLLLKLFD